MRILKLFSKNFAPLRYEAVPYWHCRDLSDPAIAVASRPKKSDPLPGSRQSAFR